MTERIGFYERVLRELVAEGLVQRDWRVLVVAGGAIDRQAFDACGFMDVTVTNLEAWWTHIASLDLPSHYQVQSPRAPKLEPWGLNTAYVFDPSGVLWHFAKTCVLTSKRNPDGAVANPGPGNRPY